MNTRKIIFVLVSLLVCVSSKAQQDNGKTYHQSYTLDSIPGFHNFETYTDKEKQHDSIYSKYDYPGKSEFRNNRSRIFLNSYTNDKPDKIDSAFVKGFPTPCDCYTDNDSLFINMGAGFFGGLGFNIEIAGNDFLSDFYEYTDDVKPFKPNLADTIYDSYVVAKSKYQYLILSEKPNFKTGQQLSGYLTQTSNYYYEEVYANKIDTHYVISKIFFTCRTKEKIRLK
jgi:hypothetical protein